MNVTITPHRLQGKVQAISSKSDAHRKIIAAALADKPCELILNRLSDDIEATIDCISKLGGGAERTENGILITPINCEDKPISLDFRESGSTARFLLPVAAGLYTECEFSGRGRLPERPFLELTSQMRKNGVEISSDKLPMETKGRLKPGTFSLPGNVSSQYITGLLLALPMLKEESEIILTSELESVAYIDMTLDTLREFGVEINKTDNRYIVRPQKYCSPGRTVVDGDWSNGAFWIVADKICGGVEIEGLSRKSRQGDKAVCELLDKCEIDASQIPDLVPILTVLAAARKGETIIKNAGRLRLKESDRLLAMTECINNLGGDARQSEDGIIINGRGSLDGGCVKGYNDHRVVMAAAIASCICKDNVIIEGAEAVNKSYPTFFDDFKSLGGVCDV